jgi:uncharacterized membrane protein
MPTSRPDTWPIPTFLIALSAVPALAGAARLIELGSGAALRPDNARFVAAPLPVTLHIVSVTIYCVAGALQFSPGLRRRQLAWHRQAGRLLIPTGLVAALSGLWMSHFYDLPPHDGEALYWMRLIVGAAMVYGLAAGYRAIRLRQIARHRVWMIRAYALGIGAGTQFLTNVPWVVLIGPPGEAARAILMGAGWGINVLLAEWIIHRSRGPIRSREPAPRGGHGVPVPSGRPRHEALSVVDNASSSAETDLDAPVPSSSLPQPRPRPLLSRVDPLTNSPSRTPRLR